jgi:hypothetical protein
MIERWKSDAGVILYLVGTSVLFSMPQSWTQSRPHVGHAAMALWLKSCFRCGTSRAVEKDN